MPGADSRLQVTPTRRHQLLCSTHRANVLPVASQMFLHILDWMLVGSHWHLPQTPAQVQAPLKSHSQRETEHALSLATFHPPHLQTPHANCISKVQGAQNPRRDLLQQHSTILLTSMLVSHLSPPSLLASDHARSSRAAGTKVISTCRESEGRSNGLIAILF